MTNDTHPAYPEEIAPVPAPTQFDAPQLQLSVIQIADVIEAVLARDQFQVDGSGLTAAVLDTGLNMQHVDFAGRIPASQNFTDGNPADATDRQGHGSNVAGIIAGNADHVGMAPGASIIPLKVLGDDGRGSFAAVENALQWVLDNHATYNISAACMSLGSTTNFRKDDILASNPTRQKIRQLRDARIAVVIAAGNDYFRFKAQGMAFPAIIRECISVGAVFDANLGSRAYRSGAIAYSTDRDRITPFSQRLHESLEPITRTDIFAPGATATSSGINGPHGESHQDGTSQSAPTVCGVILLIQELHKRLTGQLPEVELIGEWLRRGGVAIFDGDDEQDNVPNTDLSYLRVNARQALLAVARHLEDRMREERCPLAQLKC